MAYYVLEVFLWTFAIYGFIYFIEDNMWDFVYFIEKICCKLRELWRNFIDKKKG